MKRHVIDYDEFVRKLIPFNSQRSGGENCSTLGAEFSLIPALLLNVEY
jgi:hypothetical protein